MKIGIDLDGTAWEHRELFIDLINGLKSQGHKIWIITAHIGLIEKDMKLWRNRGFPNVDGYTQKIVGEEGIPSREWKLSKAKEFGYDYIFDDFDTGEVRLVKI